MRSLCSALIFLSVIQLICGADCLVPARIEAPKCHEDSGDKTQQTNLCALQPFLGLAPVAELPAQIFSHVLSISTETSILSPTVPLLSSTNARILLRI